MTVLISGGGISGLTMALTCHQIGVECVVLESVRTLAPLGVGINLQPNAVRELYDLGLADELDAIGIPTREWALVGRNGNDVWAEPRGLEAGYRWPQYSLHRGQLQMALYAAVCDRLGPEAVRVGHRVTGYENRDDQVVVHAVDRTDGRSRNVEIAGEVLVGADGLHSPLRAQMYPTEGDPVWGGGVLWRGACPGPPIRTGASFTLVGSMQQRFVHYPISPVDPETGLQLQNWIAEITYDPADGRESGDWNTVVSIGKFLPEFESWNFDWLNIPELIGSTETVWEFPMVDRNPVDRWVDGRMLLIGDAAHAMYPVGSNGASQAIMDARVVGAEMLAHGVTPDALLAVEARLREPMSELVLRNRGAGPVGILGTVDERCGGVFDDIEDVIARSEIEDYMARYRAAAGFGRDQLNAADPTIAPGARLVR